MTREHPDIARPGEDRALTQLSQISTEEAATIAPRSILVLPVGATEQHGPHLPLGVDAMMAECVATVGAERAEATGTTKVLVAPVIAFGSSHHHLPYSGTLSVRSRTLLRVLADVIDSAVQGGFTRIVVLNGHGGNEDVTHQAVRDAALDHRLTAAATSYWTPAWGSLCAAAQEYGIGPLPGHAGSFETSLLLHLAPGLVTHADQVEQPHQGSSAHPLSLPVVEQHGWVQALGGRTDGPEPASAAAGERFFELIVSGFADLLTDFAAVGTDS